MTFSTEWFWVKISLFGSNIWSYSMMVSIGISLLYTGCFWNCICFSISSVLLIKKLFWHYDNKIRLKSWLKIVIPCLWNAVNFLNGKPLWAINFKKMQCNFFEKSTGINVKILCFEENGNFLRVLLKHLPEWPEWILFVVIYSIS